MAGEVVGDEGYAFTAMMRTVYEQLVEAGDETRAGVSLVYWPNLGDKAGRVSIDECRSSKSDRQIEQGLSQVPSQVPSQGQG
jgi:hypothetical protein